jgi:hypothetical protein
MAVKSSGTSLEKIDAIDTEKRFALGETVDLGTNAYVYVQGVTSGAAGSVVTFTPAGVTTLIVGNAIGRVGILMAALDATTKYGFAQVKGLNTICKSDTVAAGLPCYIDGTAGRIDDAVVTGDLVVGMFTQTADSTNVTSVLMLHAPFVTDTLG